MKKLFLFLIVAILATSCNNSESILLVNRNVMNKQCPLVLDEVTTLKSVDYEIGDKYFITNYTIDETKCPMSAIKENSEALAQNIKANLESPLNQQFLNACIDAEVLLLYQYYGSLSGEGCWITYYPDTQEYTVNNSLGN